MVPMDPDSVLMCNYCFNATKHSDYDEFMEAICEKGERPPLPRNTLPSLRQLLEDCWNADADKRYIQISCARYFRLA